MTRNGSSPLQDNAHSATLVPLSAIELNVLNQLLEGYSINEITGNAGYSDVLVASALRGIQSKTGSNNLVQATIKLIQTDVVKI